MPCLQLHPVSPKAGCDVDGAGDGQLDGDRRDGDGGGGAAAGVGGASCLHAHDAANRSKRASSDDSRGWSSLRCVIGDAAAHGV